MELIFALLGVLSILYGSAVLINTGPTAFLWFWPLFGFVNFGMTAAIRVLRLRLRRKEETELRPFVFFFTSYALGVVVLFSLLGCIFSSAHSKPQAGFDYMIVLGTQLDHNKVSTDLRNRLDAAVDYYYENRETVFVLSGGRDDYDKSTESTVMYYYMVSKGVPAKNLMLEFYSASTYEKLRFSQLMIEEAVELARSQPPSPAVGGMPFGDVIEAERRPISIGILTSDYNVFGARCIAKRLGMEKVCVFGSPSEAFLYPHLCVREAAMIFKDRVVGNL